MKDVLTQFTKDTAEWFRKTLGQPTVVQQEAWPAIASGKDVLVSAPTGTGKTLSAFLVFIDRFHQQQELEELKQELQLIYISPLKSLVGDIKENLARPLYGICGYNQKQPVETAMRTGDTTQAERRHMLKHPPHILITTPESLYLLLTSGPGREMLKTAKTVIIDELHALIDSKRGAHLMLSIARLDQLCGQPLQRIGLSATIQPLSLAAEYLSGNSSSTIIVAPELTKKTEVVVKTPYSEEGKGLRGETFWEGLGKRVYDICQKNRSVIAFAEGRRTAEKLAYYVNQIGGAEYARTHHGSLSKEQRLAVEQELREGKLRLLCATSSMELGIDVGEVDLVLQLGCPKSVSATMQRLGRAGHKPGKVSRMYLFPRTASECLSCGLTAEAARRGGIEAARPPRLCLDVLAQHLVSMAVGTKYTIEEVMELLKRARPFAGVTRADVEDVLGMLAGDYEHQREIPARPRILYDRIHGTVAGDAYSRMLAVSAGGTIPDKGMYTVKTEHGVKLGELDEEFIFESRPGDKFLLGTFAWKILRHDKDSVIVKQTSPIGASIPFWKGEQSGRSFSTGQMFGSILHRLSCAQAEGKLEEELFKLGLDKEAVKEAAGLIKRQWNAVGVLPDDQTILIEHFSDTSGSHQIMVHSVFGRQVNSPLAILMQREAEQKTGFTVNCVEEDNGILLYSYGGQEFPEQLLQSLNPEQASQVLEAVLPTTPLFHITFRYNAARALMTGIRKKGRQPLWLQRLRSADLMDSLLQREEHPLIRETKRECLEEQWDLKGLTQLLKQIQSGEVVVLEVHSEIPSPFSLPLQMQAEAEVMYDYTPTTRGMHQKVEQELAKVETELYTEATIRRVMKQKLPETHKQPENEDQLHSLFTIEGDFVAEELEIPMEWLVHLAEQKRVSYIDPGLWIAAEQKEEYEKALDLKEPQAAAHIIRRLVRYRGAKTAEQIALRYCFSLSFVQELLVELCEQKILVAADGLYYHEKLYEQARKAWIREQREEIQTQPANRYAAFLARRAKNSALPEEQLNQALFSLSGILFPAILWESVLLPARVEHYRENLLDTVLARGEYFWKMTEKGELVFYRTEEIDWERGNDWEREIDEPDETSFSEPERLLYRVFCERGASFLQSLSGLLKEVLPYEPALSLCAKGLLTADSFLPVRYLLENKKLETLSVNQRVNAKVRLMNAGRFDVVKAVKERSIEQQLETVFELFAIVCRETAAELSISWGTALEFLRVLEYTGKVRRGYFVEGLSGAQFIRASDFDSVMLALKRVDKQVYWMPALDPFLAWGKLLKHLSERNYQNIPGTAVALYDGEPVAVLERQGKLLRIFEKSHSKEIIQSMADAYRKKRLFPKQKRLLIKEYPTEASKYLKAAGFLKEMNDYVLYC